MGSVILVSLQYIFHGSIIHHAVNEILRTKCTRCISAYSACEFGEARKNADVIFADCHLHMAQFEQSGLRAGDNTELTEACYMLSGRPMPTNCLFGYKSNFRDAAKSVTRAIARSPLCYKLCTDVQVRPTRFNSSQSYDPLLVLALTAKISKFILFRLDIRHLIQPRGTLLQYSN